MITKHKHLIVSTFAIATASLVNPIPAQAYCGFYDGFSLAHSNLDNYKTWPDEKLNRQGGLTYWLDPELTPAMKTALLNKIALVSNANSRLQFSPTPYMQYADIRFTNKEAVFQGHRGHFTWDPPTASDFGQLDRTEFSLGLGAMPPDSPSNQVQTLHWLYTTLGLYIPHYSNCYSPLTLEQINCSHCAGVPDHNNYGYLGGLHHLYPERSSGCSRRMVFSLGDNYAQGMLLTSRRAGDVPAVGMNERDLGLYRDDDPDHDYTNHIDAVSFGNDWVQNLENGRFYFSYRQPPSPRTSRALNADQVWRASSVFRRIEDTRGRIEVDQGVPDINKKGIPSVDELRILDKLGTYFSFDIMGYFHYYYYDLAALSLKGGQQPYFSVAIGGNRNLPGATIYYGNINHTFVKYRKLKKLQDGKWTRLRRADDIDALLVNDQGIQGIFEPGDTIVYSLNMNGATGPDRLYRFDGQDFSVVDLGDFTTVNFDFGPGANDFIEAPFDIDALDSAPRPTLHLPFEQDYDATDGTRPIGAFGALVNNGRVTLDSECPQIPQMWQSPDALRYSVFDSLSPDEGTIEMQIELGWDGSDGSRHAFAVAPFGDDAVPYSGLWLGKWEDDNLYFVLWDGQGDPAVISVPVDDTGLAWQTGQIHQIVARWKPEGDHYRAFLQIDGQDVGEDTYSRIESTRRALIFGYDYYADEVSASSAESSLWDFKLFDEYVSDPGPENQHCDKPDHACSTEAEHPKASSNNATQAKPSKPSTGELNG